MIGLAGGLSAVAVLFGCLLPAFLSARDPIKHLKERTSRWIWARARINSRHLLTGLQVALAVSLAIPAATFGRSVLKVNLVDPGYREPGSVLIARILARGVAPAPLADFYRQLFLELNSTPGVRASAIGGTLPFTAGTSQITAIGGTGLSLPTDISWASPRFFETQGISLVSGREFEPGDRDAVIINRVLAEKLWPRSPAVGQRLAYGPDRQLRDVIGVTNEAGCGDMLAEPSVCTWLPFASTLSASYIRVRTEGPPMAFASDLRRIVRRLNPDVAVADATTVEAYLRELTARQRVAAGIATVLTGMAILLAIGGCIALVVTMVHDSRTEIAIRMSLGATPGHLVRRIGLHMIWLTVAGGAAGAMAGMALGSMLKSEFYRTEPWDLLVLSVVPATICVITVVAAGYAGARASRITPSDYLRAANRST